MGEKAKDIVSKTKGFLGKLGKKLWAIIAVVVLVVAGVIIFVSVQGSKNPYTVLFTGLVSEDMQSVTTYLASAGVTDYKIQGTDTVLVRADQEPALKAGLLMEGYPQSGFGYETYLKNVGSLSTESDRRTMYLYDLQDRIGATIRCLDGVKDARVTIAAGEDRRYVLGQDDVLKASAQVTVTMEDGDEISKKLANAIRSLVSRSVQGLEMDKITIIDTLGNTYDGTEVDSDSTDMELQYAIEERVNNKIRKAVLEVLGPMFGPENVSVGVNTTVEMSTSYVDRTEFDLPEYAQNGNTNGEGIIGHKEWQGRVVRGDEEAGGVVGTTTNSDLPTYVERAPVNGNEQELEAAGSTDYKVDETHTQQEILAGTVSDVMVSVTINSDVPNLADPDALLAHVGRASGIPANLQAEKISIISHPFYTGEEEEPNRTTDGPVSILSGIPDWVLYALVAGLLLFILVMFFMLMLLRSKRNKAVLEEAPVTAIMPEAVAVAVEPEPEPEGADIMDVHMERSMELRRGVREFAEQNPEIAAQMVKTWLKGEEESHGSES